MTTTPDHAAPSASVQDRVDAYWTARAPAYDDYQQRPERRELDRRAWAEVWGGALPPAPARVLDVGCGSGYVACLLADAGHDVVGVDSATGMVDRAREHAAAMTARTGRAPDFRVGDAVDPDLAPGSLDAVVGRYVLWTLRDAPAALAAWWRLLRPGGTLAMVDATWFPDGLAAAEGDAFRSAYDEQVAARMPLAAADAEQKAALVAAAGFVDVRSTRLETVWELDRTHGVAPGHTPTPQHLLTARRPLAG